MKLADFDFDLPEERIALRPAEPRDAARLLVVQESGLTDSICSDLSDWLRPGDLLVFNNTKVIPARLRGVRPGDGVRGDAQIEATLHLRKSGDTWLAFAKPGKRLRVDDRVEFADGLQATVAAKGDGGEITFKFNKASEQLDIAIFSSGEMPLPPYIAGKRPTDDQDLEDYQTVYAEKDGAVAAPTAGLHFTPELIERLEQSGIGHVTLTLHVGAGTFLPVKVENIADHKMHAEYGEISQETADRINAARAAGGRIVSVGTTSMRLLESAADNDRVVHPFTGETDIFITPGYGFKAVDVLMTNFHLPKSTLFMLVSAFSGLEAMHEAYAHAVEQGYRFYSYGDACLLFSQDA